MAKENFINKKGTAQVIRDLYIRIGKPTTTTPYLKLVKAGDALEFIGWVEDGENFKRTSKWFKTKEGNYFWAGNVTDSGVADSMLSAPANPITGLKFLHKPLDELIYTQKFGESPDVYSQWGMLGHNGLDFRTKTKTDPKGERPVYAVMDGVVSEAVPLGKGGYGKNVRLAHEGGSETIYAHLSSLKVAQGQKIKCGDLLGITGNTGASTGPHLHFGYRPPKATINYDNGYKGWIDPEPLLS